MLKTYFDMQIYVEDALAPYNAVLDVSLSDVAFVS